MLFWGILLTLIQSASAATLTPTHEIIWDQSRQEWITPDELARRIELGTVLLLGEQHAVPNDSDLGHRLHHLNQTRLIQTLGKDKGMVSVGMEFFNYPDQPLVDSYVLGRLSESDFLQAIKWGGNPFESYREQVLTPVKFGGRTWAINIPREVSSAVARGGPDSLTPEQARLLPPLWELGSTSYFARFKDVMGGHVPTEKVTNYFWAQSLWDDTMAWQASLTASANEIYVLIVGEFHVQFRDGLQARLAAHGIQKSASVIQEQIDGPWDLSVLGNQVTPDPDYGVRADYIWFYQP